MRCRHYGRCGFAFSARSYVKLGAHRIETPAGIVEIELVGPNEVLIENVPSYRFREYISVDVSGLGLVTDDIA